MDQESQSKAKLGGGHALASWAEVGVFAALLGALGLLAHGQLDRAQAATQYANTLSDLRAQMRAVEAYAVDTTDYPRMSWGMISGSGFSFNDTYAGAQTYGTLTTEITTPIAYLSELVEDPVLTAGESFPSLYSYHALDTHRFLFGTVGSLPVPGLPGYVYVPFNAVQQNRFEGYFGSFALWGCGPSGSTNVAGNKYWLQYDPTNGATSDGNIFISPNTPRPSYIPPTVF